MMLEKPQSRIRAFIAAQLPDPVREVVAEVQRALKSAIHTNAIRWTPPHQIHLTLRFLGELDADSVAGVEQALRGCCQGTPPFVLCAEGLGAFPNKSRSRVIWLGVGGQLDPLRELQAKVTQETVAWGEREEREFHPHLTLARVKATRPADWREVARVLLQGSDMRSGSWRIDRLELMRSELLPAGAQHSTLATVPFLAG